MHVVYGLGGFLSEAGNRLFLFGLCRGVCVCSLQKGVEGSGSQPNGCVRFLELVPLFCCRL